MCSYDIFLPYLEIICNNFFDEFLLSRSVMIQRPQIAGDCCCLFTQLIITSERSMLTRYQISSEKFHCRPNCVYEETVGVESRDWKALHTFSVTARISCSVLLIKSDCLASIALFLCPLNPIPTSSSPPLGCAVISLCPH